MLVDLREVLTEPGELTRWGVALGAILIAVAAALVDRLV